MKLYSSSKDKNTQIFVEDVYPDLINWLAYNNYGYGINATLIEYDTSANGLFATQYTAPVTPFIVSELRGSSLTRLFYFESIPDGNSANKLFKISFQNIDPSTGNFDIIIRAFGDTDANPVILENSDKSLEEQLINLKARNKVITHVDQQLLTLELMSKMNTPTPEEIAEQTKKNSNK